MVESGRCATSVPSGNKKQGYLPWILGLLAMLLVGCDNAASQDKNTSASAPVGWPRTVQTPKGPLTLTHPPQRIVSTSVTLSGTLLAINAPLVGSGATSPDTVVADEQGFFRQWSAEAKARHVKPLYITEPNAEAIAAAAPDMIIIAATGGDSALKLYEQLSAIAPTLVVDYGDKSWQQLADYLGQAIGHETDAHQVIERFEQRVQAVKQAIQLPPQPVSALVYYEDGRGFNLWTPSSAQGQLLHELGFQLASLPDNLPTETRMGKRQDVLQISGENMAASLNGQSLLLFATDENTVKRVIDNPFLSHLDPVMQHRVWAMGPDTFRLDYYSASNMLNQVEHHFRRPAAH
ncbi:Fe2+-enterobactin ABC transporter substrate-binding protein [Dickeya oryzae]|uniref:Fe2+-enterobactin ABC transporter substrate-binding protein n=1 Tax=Dickeya oryzae TaxID=1240404 RepID=UPI001AED0226|nr:Fe2+-enterobactin ABC transporter substrate-binding protein [Dickeya oryzae]MBP2847058.1 Fe2+-enterobactin ABC transporter substrate-binding protein [Dickeya oryzae]